MEHNINIFDESLLLDERVNLICALYTRVKFIVYLEIKLHNLIINSGLYYTLEVNWVTVCVRAR